MSTDSSTPMDKLERAIVIVRADDWTGIYVEGLLGPEAHSFSDEQLIRIGQENPTLDIISKECDYDWAHDLGNFPYNLREVKFQ